MRNSILLIVSIAFFSIYGQSVRIDSLVKLSKYDEALRLAKKQYEQANKEEAFLEMALLQNEIAALYFKKNNYDSTQVYANKALAVGTTKHYPEVIMGAYLALANIHYAKFEDLKALARYQQIDSVATAYEHQDVSLIKAYFNRGKVLLRTYSVNDTSYIGKAENYFKKAIHVAQQLGNESEEHYGYIMLGNVYGQRGEFEKAMPFFTKSAAYFEKTNSYKDLSGIYWSLGIIYTDLNDYQKADYYYAKRLQLMLDNGNEGDIANAKRTYGGFLYRIKNHRAAIPYFTEAYEYYKDSDAGSSGILLGITKNLAESYFRINAFEESATFYELSMRYQDTLDSRKQKELALDLEAKYETQQKEQELQLLAAQKETIELQKSKQRTLFVLGFSIVSLVVVFLFFLLRNRQKTHKKLKELDQAKSKFFENISHEFRTPLTLISGPIEQQLKSKNLAPVAKRNLIIAKNNAKRLLQLVNQLLDLSKIEADQYTLAVQQVQLDETLSTLISSFSYQAELKGIELVTVIDGTDAVGWVDLDILEKVVTNLMSNAIKFTPEEGKITCGVKLGNDVLSIQIVNNGVHLTENELEHIFIRFHSSNENQLGTGIGLALTKELVERHKGTIDANSDTNSVRFSVKLPISEKLYRDNEKLPKDISITELSDLSNKAPQLQKMQDEYIEVSNTNDDLPVVLLIDDNADLRAYLSSLCVEKYIVYTAKDGKEGFSKAKQYVPDVIITDLMMPNEDGIQLTKNVKDNINTSHIPIIMLTAKSGDENVLSGIETGADAYITKPFNSDILLATIENLLVSRKKLQERFSQEVLLTPQEISIDSVEQKFLMNIKEIMDQELVESDFTAESFAQSIGMSRMQLHRKLKALTGLTTTEFIRTQRLKLAADLLSKSNANVSEIGYAVGFNNHSYFTKCFKEEFGVSPSDYSKSN
ncbi:response regulator [Aquimarina brevivitae]|uniref:histidine kinase n=1 Tax=Aquimarina brevivitae TaxID=323412 RepID=A0A4Q7P0V1_9FLAO|nr:response regulator [Aquimarina brevivitae]RZS93431.1 phospho-acceptor domain-containing protein [Aquimarina brevivitae]